MITSRSNPPDAQPGVRLALGTLALAGMSQREASALIGAALEIGVRWFDTAESYGAGAAEARLAGGLGNRANDVKIAVKLAMPSPDGPTTGKQLITRAQESLRRLRRERIDVAYLHMPDPRADPEDLLEALSGLIDRGWITHAGWSNFTAQRLRRDQAACDARGLHRPDFLQTQYSILERTSERELFPLTGETGVYIQAWGVLASGWLTEATVTTGAPSVDPARARRRPESFDVERVGNRRKLKVVAELRDVAAHAGLSVEGLATAFVAQNPRVDTLIVGPRTIEELDLYARASAAPFPAGVGEAIDALCPPGAAVNQDDVVRGTRLTQRTTSITDGGKA